ncbi:MAG: post-transcriptional regulator [Bavariicoccus seileri]|uniref:post-transcriptional regulator n=1 Tax=Bavariicoccus seileri TaxID=549685 RepID=UPI003F9AFE13
MKETDNVTPEQLSHLYPELKNWAITKASQFNHDGYSSVSADLILQYLSFCWRKQMPIGYLERAVFVNNIKETDLFDFVALNYQVFNVPDLRDQDFKELL